MIRTIWLLALLAGFCSLNAQQTEGIVIYERKINLHRRIQDEQMRAMMPEFRVSKHQLRFNDTVSVYKTLPEAEMPEAGSEGGNRIFIRAGGADNSETFRDFNTLRSVEMRELGAKTYLIEDTIRLRNWKLSNETKQFLGFTCRKATCTEQQLTGIRRVNFGSSGEQTDTSRPQPRDVKVEAWYAEGLNAPAGPESYGMLPGVILELVIDDGAVVFTALEVKKEVSEKELREPKKGKRISRAAFMQLQSEAFGGGRMMRMQ
ncbi:MAG TPA: GLPGLI family protein [Chitinophagaceae bacterium]